MKKLFTLLFFISSLHLAGQDSIVYKLNRYFRVIDNSDYSYRRVIKKINDTIFQQRDYYRAGALFQQTLFKDKDMKVRNGRYDAFDGKGRFAVTGYYYNNKPVGTWYFYDAGKHDRADSLDYDFYSNLKNQLSVSRSLSDSIKYNPETEKESVYPGGDKAWKRFLTRSFEEFPEDYPIARGKQSIISFMIDKTGRLINVYPVTSIDPRVDLEIVRIIRSSPGWEPAEQNGRKVISVMSQPINF